MSAELGIPARACDSSDDAVANADVVCTITNSREPVIDGAKLQAGTHVNAAGSNGWIRREVDDETIKRASLIVVDDMSDAKIECGEFGLGGGAPPVPLGDGRGIARRCWRAGRRPAGHGRDHALRVAGARDRGRGGGHARLPQSKTTGDRARRRGLALALIERYGT